MKRSITLRNQDITYYEWGNNQNTTIVFLHGLGSNAYTFSEVAFKLKASYHIISIDLPGHGETDLHQEESFSLEVLAIWLHQALLQLGVSNSHIAGHSWGAYIALVYSSLYKTKSVILLDGGYINASLIPGTSLEEELEGATSHLQSYQFPSIEAFTASLNSNKTELNIEAQKRSLFYNGDKWRLIVSESTAHAIIKANFEHPTLNTLSSIDNPVLLLRSTIPEEMNEIRKLATDRLLKMLDLMVHDIHASHDVYLEKPDRVKTILIQWLKQLKERNHV
ncbi:alpha/beta fold hydrolase [Pontibacillus marinus]|uniref:AB hydrolase-1 domain-containing protein n=1 Tax=Pontibacillus marinus BH030004 = DSM 16465 TaxID=1385511 RepID=A0A0A5G5Y3_9BACI|nr:alpha/beta hydrolase [Pontibacillus marinus]KGX87464.1 hypothetical protein N783_09735 [Pontibacillus marinus BH030004 = DSM 16465]